MNVFVSSTYTDLKEYREQAHKVIIQMGLNFVGAENYGVSPSQPVEKSLEDVKACDLFVLIVGFRYGFVPENNEKSITHLEYETAVNAGKPILAFFLSKDVPIQASYVQSDSRWQSFRNEVIQNRIVGSISSPGDLAAQLAVGIHHFLKRTRVDESESKVQEELKKCREDSEGYKDTIEELGEKIRRIVPADPIWRGRNFEVDELQCFVLLPFRDEFFEIYEASIVPAVNKTGLQSLHAGEIFSNREIVEDIWDSICRARLIIADVTGRNPNVFYELGICHTLGKECVVITQNKEDVPFDIRHRRFIEYETSKLMILRSALEKTIKQVLTTA